MQIFSAEVFEVSHTMHLLWGEQTLIDSENLNYAQRDLVLFVMLYASAPALVSLFLIPVLLPF